MAIEPGEFCWYKLVTADPAAATAFYTHVVGWTAKVSEDPDKPCTVMLAPGGRAVASIARRRSEGIDGATVPSWVGHVLVESLDDAVTRLAAAGGLVRDRPIATPGKGRFASVLDPDGAEFRLFEAAAGTADMPTLFGSPGYVGWRELHATDRDMAFAFYARLFGQREETIYDMGGSIAPYLIFKIGAAEFGYGGMTTSPVGALRRGWTFYLNVEDIFAAGARTDERGGVVLEGPREVPGGLWMLAGRDPQGGRFSLISGPRQRSADANED